MSRVTGPAGQTSHMTDTTTVQIQRADRARLRGLTDARGDSGAHETLHFLLENVEIKSQTDGNPASTGIIVEKYKHE